ALGQDQVLVPQEVVNIHALGRQKLVVSEISRAHTKFLVAGFIHDERALRNLELCQDPNESLRLDFRKREVVEYEEPTFFELQAERTLEGADAHLARRSVRIVAGLGSERLSSASELRRIRRAVTRSSGPL